MSAHLPTERSTREACRSGANPMWMIVAISALACAPACPNTPDAQAVAAGAPVPEAAECADRIAAAVCRWSLVQHHAHTLEIERLNRGPGVSGELRHVQEVRCGCLVVAEDPCYFQTPLGLLDGRNVYWVITTGSPGCERRDNPFKGHPALDFSQCGTVAAVPL